MSDDPKREELLRLQRKNGGILLPKKVIAAARSPSNPLHDEFEWDDSIAGEKYRIEQAEHLIRRFRITYREQEADVRPVSITTGDVPEFSPHPDVRGYSRTADLLRGPQRKRLLLKEYDRCQGHVERFCGYLREAGMRAVADRITKVMKEALAELGRLSESEAGG